jgi:hypothetical protein
MPVCVLEEVECGLKAVRFICHLNLSSTSETVFNFHSSFLQQLFLLLSSTLRMNETIIYGLVECGVILTRDTYLFLYHHHMSVVHLAS